jgi:hypothetical protein
MTSVPPLTRMLVAARRGRMSVAGLLSNSVINNNRNNASHPRAGD